MKPRDHSKFHSDPSNCCCVIAIFVFFPKWRPSAVLDLNTTGIFNSKYQKFYPQILIKYRSQLLHLWQTVDFVINLWSWRSLKITENGAIRWAICRFLLVVCSKNASILHRFRDITTRIQRYTWLPATLRGPSVSITQFPSPFSGQHLNYVYNDCLEDKWERYQNCSVMCCVRQLCIMMHRHTHEHFSKTSVGLGLGFSF